MLFLLSPAKALDYDTELSGQAHTQPLFVKQSKALIEVLRTQSPQQVAALMDLSDALSSLNVARYQAWSGRATTKNARQAVLAFNGDVYGGLDARSLAAADLDWAQEHLCILSGLYGVLRPLDLMPAKIVALKLTLQSSWQQKHRGQLEMQRSIRTVVWDLQKSMTLNESSGKPGFTKLLRLTTT